MKTTSKRVKELGFKSVAEAAAMVGACPNTLDNWHKKGMPRFEYVLQGAKSDKLKAYIVALWNGKADRAEHSEAIAMVMDYQLEEPIREGENVRKGAREN